MICAVKSLESEVNTGQKAPSCAFKLILIQKNFDAWSMMPSAQLRRPVLILQLGPSRSRLMAGHRRGGLSGAVRPKPARPSFRIRDIERAQIFLYMTLDSDDALVMTVAVMVPLAGLVAARG